MTWPVASVTMAIVAAIHRVVCSFCLSESIVPMQQQGGSHFACIVFEHLYLITALCSLRYSADAAVTLRHLLEALSRI